MATGPAATTQGGAAFFGGIALQEAMLAFAPDFRRLILAFHFIIKKTLPRFSGSNTPLPRRIRESECEKIPAQPKVSTAQIGQIDTSGVVAYVACRYEQRRYCHIDREGRQ
jgi:hypothetical protein